MFHRSLGIIAAVVLAAGCSGAGGAAPPTTSQPTAQQPSTPLPAPTQTTMAVASTARTYATFAEWLADFRVEALAAGISAATFDTAFAGISPDQRVIDNDQSQPEVTRMRIPVGTYGGFGAEVGIDGILSQTVDVQIDTPSLLIQGLELLVERGEYEELPTLVHPLRAGEGPAEPAASSVGD